MKRGSLELALCACLLLGSARASTAQETRRLTLTEAVERAVSLNEDVLVARAEEARAAGQVREVRANSLPELNVDLGYTRNVQTPVLFFNTAEGVQQISIGNDNEFALNVSLRQPILDFSLGPARAAARMAEDASAASVEATRNTVALATRRAYYTVLLDRRLLGVEEKALEAAQLRLEQVQEFVEAGLASEFDLLTAQVQVENIRPGLIEARNRLELDLNTLKRTIGMPLDRSIEPTDSLAPPADEELPLEEAMGRALSNRADLRGQQLSVGLQTQSLTSERAAALPTLALDAGVTRRASSDRLVPPGRDFSQSTSVGLSVEIPLFDGRARSGRIQQAEAALKRERFRLQRLTENVRLQVQQAVLAIEAGREQVRASEGTVRRAERALEIAQVRFENGLSTQVELNDAELAVTEARSNHARALYQYNVARAELRAAMGQR